MNQNIEIFYSKRLKYGKIIGDGAYSDTHLANDLLEKREVAIKRNFNDLTCDFCGPIREIDIIKYLDHPYITPLYGICLGNPFSNKLPPIPKKYKEDKLYFVFDRAAYDGFTFCKFEDTRLDFIKIVMMQTLLSLEFIHAQGIIHRDIKPSNFLWFRDGAPEFSYRSMKLCDFGLAEFYTNQKEQCLNVVTSVYRAPELLLNNRYYDYKIDIWSLGCVFFEMLSKKFLLEESNESNENLLRVIMRDLPFIESIDEVKKMDVDSMITSQELISLNNRKNINRKDKLRSLINLSTEMEKEFNSISGSYDQFLDLLSHMFAFLPQKRITAQEALNHPFFNGFKFHINEIRLKYPTDCLNDRISDRIKICPILERKWIIPLVEFLYKSRDKVDWYHHRLLFHTIDLFDHYLSFLVSRKKKRFSEETKDHGYYLTYNDVLL